MSPPFAAFAHGGVPGRLPRSFRDVVISSLPASSPQARPAFDPAQRNRKGVARGACRALLRGWVLLWAVLAVVVAGCDEQEPSGEADSKRVQRFGLRLQPGEGLPGLKAVIAVSPPASTSEQRDQMAESMAGLLAQAVRRCEPSQKAIAEPTRIALRVDDGRIAPPQQVASRSPLASCLRSDLEEQRFPVADAKHRTLHVQLSAADAGGD